MKTLSGEPWALLINECQRGLLDSEVALFPGIQQQAQARAIVPQIARLAAAFRQRQWPVIHVHMGLREDFAGFAVNNPAAAYIRKVKGLVEGSEQAQAALGLEPQQSDHVVKRYAGMTVFYGNHLEQLLANLRVKTLVAAGVSTNAAIPGMVLGGLDRGYQVVVAEDCIAGASSESHDAILTHLIRPLARVISASELIESMSTSID